MKNYCTSNYSKILIIGLVLTCFLTACRSTKNSTNNKLSNVTASKSDNNNNQNTSTDSAPDNTDARVDTLRWCDTLAQSATRQIVVCFEQIEGKLTADTVDVIDINEEAIFKPTLLDTTIEKKLAYRVAVLLPFMSKGFAPTPLTEIPSKSIKSVEFYEGLSMALDSLKAEGVSLFVNVYDTQRDSATVVSIFNKREFQEADLIIGTLNSKITKLVADYAKANQKPLIVPFNSRDDLTMDNPYYIQVNPSFEVHSQLIVEQMHRLESDKELFRTALEHNYFALGLQQDSLRIEAIQESYASYKNEKEARIQQMILKDATIDIEMIQSKFDKNKLNVIIIPSYQNEGFVYNALREIQKLVDKVEPKKGYQIVLIGMDRWRYYTRINFEYFESMNLHLSSPFYIDLDSELIQQFKSDYKTVYGIGTREFGIIGFDLMLYFGRMLHKYGNNFQAHLWKDKASYKHTRFEIEPDFIQRPALDANNADAEAAILRNYENKYLHFLKFKNYQLQRFN